MESISYKNKTTKMFEELSQKPAIGILSGIGSGICLFLQKFLTDEVMLKLVGAAGVWCGAMVALLTFALKMIEITEKVRTKLKNRRNEKNRSKN